MSEKIIIYKLGNSFFSNKKEAIELANSSYFGELKEGKVYYALLEILFLLEQNKASLIENNKELKFETLLKESLKKNKELEQSYEVFKDLRKKGMIVKEGLKFGTDFRVYEKGQKPGKNHAPYLLHIASSKEKINLKDLCAKARVSHSTSKILLLAIIDSEHDINYYSINWKSIK